MNSQQTQQNIAVPSLNLLKVQKYKEKQEIIKEIISQDKLADKIVRKDGQRDHYKPNAKSMAVQSLDNQTHSPKNNNIISKVEALMGHEDYPRLFKKKQALQELREIQREVSKAKKPIIMNKNSSSQNINMSRQLGKHKRQDSSTHQQNTLKNENSTQNQKIIQNQINSNINIINGQSINEAEKRQLQQISVMEHEFDIDGETAANSANQYPNQKLQSHLKDLAQIQNDLNRLNNDQKLSKNNFEKMKMFFKRNNTRSRLKQRGGPHDDDGSDINNKSSRRNKNQSSSFDYYKDNQSNKNSDSQKYSDSQSILAGGNIKDLHNQVQYKNQSSKHLPMNHKNNIEKAVKAKGQFETQKYDTSMNDLSVVQQRLKKECKGDLGIVNPMKAFSILNMIQKEDCPEAYEPEIVTLHKQKLLEKQKQEEYNNDIDKTLFDFDDDIDKLSNVSERYQVQGFYLIEEPQLNHNKTIQEPKKETSFQDEEQSKYKQKKQKNKDVNFEIDQVKAEMIKDLSYYNKKNRDESDSPVEEKPRSKKANHNISYNGNNNKSRMNHNEHIISSMKQRRNIFNHQPIHDEPVNKSQNRKNRASLGMSQGINRYKPSTQISKELGNIQTRIATSAAPLERNQNEQLAMKKEQTNIGGSNIKSDINTFKQKNERPGIPSTLERPGACMIKDIYGQMSKMNYEGHFKNTMMILDQQSQFSRPLTSNNRITTAKNNLFNQNNSMIQSNELQLSNVLNPRPRNQIPFQNLHPAFSEVALNNSLNQYQHQQQNNSAYVASKKGTLYPGITANHKHIDRIEKYFCSNIQKKTSQLQNQAEQQRKQLQQLKFQQSKLIGTSINFGENIPATHLNTVTHLGSISSKRRLHQHELFI